jgi:hypothetical protein
MICSAKPGLTEDLYIVQKEQFSISYYYMCNMHISKRPSIFTGCIGKFPDYVKKEMLA